MMTPNMLRAGRLAKPTNLLRRSYIVLRSKPIGAQRSLIVGGTLNIHRYFSSEPDGSYHDVMLREPIIKRNVPQRVSQKIVTASDAVELIRDGDTVAVSGFVAQGAPEAVLKAVGE